jgi:hypothetical protein
VNSEQIRPLLPGAGPSMTIVTSRMRLEGLAASHGAKLITLSPLSEVDSMSLLASFHEPDRSFEEISKLCGGLPLALRIAAARMQTVGASTLAAQLRDESSRLWDL